MIRPRPRDSNMPATPEAVERLDLGPQALSASLARRFIRQFAARHSLAGEVVDQLVLAGCELVTNAVLHARTDLHVALELHPDRVRVSVADGSSAPASLRQYRPEAQTGRGLALVSAIGRSWGVDPDGDGKRIWADIDRMPSPPAEEALAADQVPTAPRQAAHDDAGPVTVRYLGVPVKAFLDLQQYNDALVRELELIGIGLEGPGASSAVEPERLVRLVERFGTMFRESSDEYRDLVAAADARGETTVDIEVRAARSAVSAARAYVGLLEEAENLCRSGVLLTPPLPAHVSSLRRWFVDQLVAQLDGAPPLPPGEECLVP
jgi:histidine kinase-like protein